MGDIYDSATFEPRKGIGHLMHRVRTEMVVAVDHEFADDEQLAAMVRARDDGLIAGIGLSNITVEHLWRALDVTDIVCVQNLFNLADLSSLPVLRECSARGIAFVPFFPLGAGSLQSTAVLGYPRVTGAAERLGVTPGQIALAWALELVPNLLLIPGTASRQHLAENIAAQYVELDEQAQRELRIDM